MTSTVLLPLGLLSIFAAVAIVVVSEVQARQRRLQVARSLEFVATGWGATLEQPRPSFLDRVVVPALVAVSGLGRRLTFGRTTSQLARRLDLAGNPGWLDVERVLGLKVVGLVVGALLTLLLWPGPLLLLVVPLGALAGAYLPDVLIYNTGDKRQVRIQTALPDSLDLLTVAVEAGLGFDAALSHVARNTKGPLSSELHRALQEMQIGKSRGEALQGLADRSTVQDLRRFVAAMLQADRLGVPIGTVLRQQAKEMRVKRTQRAEEKAHKVPVRILFPTVLFLLPALFLVILGPAAISISKAL